jgi:redox-sensing transcriptional repressor
VFADHGFNIAAVFDTDAAKVGDPIGNTVVLDYGSLRDIIEERNIIVGVLAVPAASAQRVADDLVSGGVRIIFNYSEALLHVPSDVTVHTTSPAVELLYALYFYLT